MADKALGVSIAASVDAPSTISSKPTMSQRMNQLLSAAALSASMLLGHNAAAAEVENSLADAKAACTAEATKGTANLRALIEKKMAEGIEPAKLDMLKTKLQGNYDSLVGSCVKSAEADVKIAKADAKLAELKAQEQVLDTKIAQADTKIAQADAQIIQADATLEMGKKVDIELAAKQEFFAAFVEGKKTPEEYNQMIAQLPKFIEQVQTYIALARKTFKNQEALANVEKLQAGLVKIAAFAPKGTVILSSL